MAEYLGNAYISSNGGLSTYGCGVAGCVKDKCGAYGCAAAGCGADFCMANVCFACAVDVLPWSDSPNSRE